MLFLLFFQKMAVYVQPFSLYKIGKIFTKTSSYTHGDVNHVAIAVLPIAVFIPKPDLENLLFKV